MKKSFYHSVQVFGPYLCDLERRRKNEVKIFPTVPFNGLVQTSVSGEASAWWSGTELRSGAEPEVPEERGKCLGYLCESVVWSGDTKRKLNFFLPFHSKDWSRRL